MLFAALLPAAIFALGVRGTRIALRGSLLFLVTALAWLLAVTSGNDLALVYPSLAWPATLSIGLWPDSERRQ